jgi:hypothetical protein
MTTFWQDFRRALAGFVVTSALMLVWSVFGEVQDKAEPWRVETASVDQSEHASAQREASTHIVPPAFAGASKDTIRIIPQPALFA